jgi:hypothetical protein
MEISLAKIAEIVGGEIKGDVHKRIRDVALLTKPTVMQ